MRSTDVPEQSYDLRTREGFLQRTTETTDRRIPVTYRDATTGNAEVLAWCDSFVPGDGSPPAPPAGGGGAPRSLLILGTTGVGKTYAAYAAIRLLAARGLPVKWEAMTAPDLYARLRPRDGIDSEGEYRKVADSELLMLDDLGAAKASEWTEEINYRLLNHRSAAGLPMIVTSNLPRTAAGGRPSLSLALGDRVMSRLAGMCQIVILRGPDRRRPS
jgi:DNA replication protein DnaC